MFVFENCTLQSSLIAILFSILVYYIVIYHWNRRWLYYYAAKIHGPPCWPIIGNALHFAGGTEDILNNTMHIFEKYKPPFRVWLGNRLFFGIAQPKNLEVIFNNSLHKDKLYEFSIILGGNGLFTSPVDIWRRHRKIILPTFNQTILNSFVDVFGEQSKILIMELEKIVGTGYIDILPILSRCTLDIICETAMGKKVHAQTEKSDYAEWINRGLEIIYMRMFQIWFHPDCLWKLSPLYNELNDISKNIMDFIREIIFKKREEYKKRQKLKQFDDYYEEETSKRKAFLDYMIELSEEGANLTDDEIIGEATNIMIAGSDSTGSMNSFALLMLGMHSNIQDKVYEELYTIFGNSNRNVTPEDLNKMIYLERVIKETLRLFPVGPVIVRALHDDIKLDSYILPKGSSCVLGIIHTHRDPEIWKDPLKFDPDRFLPDEVAKRHPYSYIPFSAGPRNCIGPKYAMMAMKSVLSTILRYYKVSTSYKKVSDIKVRADLLLRCVGGYQVAVECR